MMFHFLFLFPLIVSNILTTTATMSLVIEEQSAVHGRGLFVSKDVAADAVKEGTLLLEEKPLVAVRHLDCNFSGTTCAFCLKPLSIESFGEYSCRDDCAQCKNECGNCYCDKDCRDADDVQGGHRVLCVGKLDIHHPMFRFKRHAVLVQKEVFLIAAKAIARIVLQMQGSGWKIDAAEASAVFRRLQSRPWPQVLSFCPDLLLDDEDEEDGEDGAGFDAEDEDHDHDHNHDHDHSLDFGFDCLCAREQSEKKRKGKESAPSLPCMSRT